MPPKTQAVYKSILRPVGQPYTNKSIDMSTDQLLDVTLPAATQEEIDHTVKVMGGEDWELWIEALEKENLLAKGCITVAYSYIGPEVTNAVYRNGTIGKAKEHLEATSRSLDEKLKKYGGRAYISVNKALVTQSSSAIPFIPLYFIILSKVMQEKGVEEGCIEQIYRLFKDRLFAGGNVPVDESGFIRVDDHEMRPDIQAIVMKHWNALNQGNLAGCSDLTGYHRDFLKLFGFGLKGVDYNADVDPLVAIPSIK
jgi:enoyl-[acyl-carrier protein] reductase/trans-2-enoyl-CoA reductase (NAD+)